ncbi:MAG TPA: YdeI/OmpD-associated family protein [Ktedonobacterales bacterium]|nr:YdeI/OmpD-associated family protein [Ktedonobacterales bacterium]
MRFRASIQLSGKTATGIEVPAEVVASLGPSKRPSVRVTINGYTYRSTVAPMGGVFMLPISAEHRQSAGVAAGDEVEVDIELDTEPREVVAPPDLREALDSDAQARQVFDMLSYSQKQQLVLSIEGAKTSETRLRRLAKVVSTLRESTRK